MPESIELTDVGILAAAVVFMLRASIDGVVKLVQSVTRVRARYAGVDEVPILDPQQKLIYQQVRSAREELEPVAKQTADLHEWHSRVDADGVPIWYVRQSLEKQIERLADAIEELARKEHAT